MIKFFRMYLPYFFAIVILGLDQWSKALVRNTMSLGESIPIIQDVFHLTYIENTGISFGLFSGHTNIFVIISVMVLIALLVFSWKESQHSAVLRYGVAMIVSGAVGNIIDRVTKASVTDMFDCRIWPIFNVADIAVCVGFGLLILYILFDQGERHVKDAD